MKRNRNTGSAILDVMDVTGRQQRGHRLCRIDPASDRNEVRVRIAAAQFVHGFVFLTKVNSDHAPRHVIVHRSALARQPDERDNRETSVRLDVQDVLPVIGFARIKLPWV